MSNPRRRAEVARVQEEGRQAARAGKSRQSNPYHTMNRLQWWDGYDKETARASKTPPRRAPEEVLPEELSPLGGMLPAAFQDIGEPMTPTARFRWHGHKNPVTKEVLETYLNEHGSSLAEARQALVKETPLSLQQWWEGASGGEWRNIDVVVEPHPDYA